MAKPKRPRDTNQLAKLIMDLSTGEAVAGNESKKVAATRIAGSKGGASRASKLTPDQRAEIARMAATARWKKSR